MSLAPRETLQAVHQATVSQQDRDEQQRQMAEIPEEKTKHRHLLIGQGGTSHLLCLPKATEVGK